MTYTAKRIMILRSLQILLYIWTNCVQRHLASFQNLYSMHLLFLVIFTFFHWKRPNIFEYFATAAVFYHLMLMISVTFHQPSHYEKVRQSWFMKWKLAWQMAYSMTTTYTIIFKSFFFNFWGHQEMKKCRSSLNHVARLRSSLTPP